MTYLKNKTVGFYLSIIGAVLALVGLIVYRQATNTETVIVALLAAVVVLQIVACVLLGLTKGHPAVNLILIIESALIAAALIFSFRTQVDGIGYVVSGLYGIKTIQMFVISAGLMLLSLILYLIASYQGFEKEVQS